MDGLAVRYRHRVFITLPLTSRSFMFRVVTTASIKRLAVKAPNQLATRWADGVGCLFFLCLAVWTLVRMPQMGLFLLPTLAHELLMSVAFIIRDRPKEAGASAAGRIAAYASSFLIFSFFHAARWWRPEWLIWNTDPRLSGTGILIWLVGSILVIASIWWLRYAFSVEPEARRFIRVGPYRVVRHPIYLGYVFQYTGMWLVYPSAAFAVVFAAWTLITLARIRAEEAVLARAFPEYRKYKESTPALVPLYLGD